MPVKPRRAASPPTWTSSFTAATPSSRRTTRRWTSSPASRCSERAAARFGVRTTPRLSTRRVVVGVLEQDDVGLAARFTDAGDVDGRPILHRAHLFARAAPDAEGGIDVGAL